MGWMLLSLLLLGCSNYARNYTPPTLKDGAIRARNLLTLKQRREFDGVYLEALRQKYKGNYDAAFDLLDYALTINPNDADALFQQGLILLQSAGYSDSLLRQRGERQLQLAQQLSPSNAHYREMLGNYWIQTNRYERALRLYEQLVTTDATVDNLKVLEGLQERTNNWDAALQTLDRITTLEGKSNELVIKKNQYLRISKSHPRSGRHSPRLVRSQRGRQLSTCVACQPLSA